MIDLKAKREAKGMTQEQLADKVGVAGSKWKCICECGKECVVQTCKSIRKHGAENFTVEQIDVACGKAELDQKEKYWIEYYDSMNRSKGYNMTAGGRSGAVDMKRSEETKRKIANSITGEKHWHATKVKNIETGEIFNTVSEAAKKYNTAKSNIIGVCTGRPHYKTCKGYHWEYA